MLRSCKVEYLFAVRMLRRAKIRAYSSSAYGSCASVSRTRYTLSNKERDVDGMRHVDSGFMDGDRNRGGSQESRITVSLHSSVWK